jgi:hypothetical protein
MRDPLTRWYYLLCAWIWCLGAVITEQVADPDLWGRLSIGALIVENRHFPYKDIFSYTAWHRPWIDHEWLSGLIFYLALRWGGEAGLHLLKYGLLLGIFYLLFSLAKQLARTTESGYRTLFWGLFFLISFYSSGFYPTLRAQIFSLFFFTLFLWLCECVRIQKKPAKRLWWLVPTGIFWANAHGGFVLGIAMLGLYGIGQIISEKHWKSAFPFWHIAFSIAVLSSILNPYGFAYWAFLLKALTMPRPGIPEWKALPLFSSAYWNVKMLMIALILRLACLWRQAKSDDEKVMLLTPALILLSGMALTIKGIRFQPFLLLSTLAYLPLLVQNLPLLKRVNTLSKALPGIIAALNIGLIFLFLPDRCLKSVVNDEALTQTKALIPYPVGVVDYLQKSSLHGNLLNPFTVGEFLYWTLYPRFKIAWDGRYEEVYTQRQYLALQDLYGFPHRNNPTAFFQTINNSPADFMLIEIISPNQALMTQNSAWQLLYRDRFYFLYGRKTRQAIPVSTSPNAQLLSPRIYTIQDFFTPSLIERFRYSQ